MQHLPVACYDPLSWRRATAACLESLTMSSIRAGCTGTLAPSCGVHRHTGTVQHVGCTGTLASTWGPPSPSGHRSRQTTALRFPHQLESAAGQPGDTAWCSATYPGAPCSLPSHACDCRQVPGLCWKEHATLLALQHVHQLHHMLYPITNHNAHGTAEPARLSTATSCHRRPWPALSAACTLASNSNATTRYAYHLCSLCAPVLLVSVGKQHHNQPRTRTCSTYVDLVAAHSYEMRLAAPHTYAP
jgi:hypothetical protein